MTAEDQGRGADDPGRGKDARAPHEGDPGDGLLTPQEREARRRAAELREESDRLVRRAARATAPREFTHRFPPPAAGDE
jgi:hypothetical protein